MKLVQPSIKFLIENDPRLKIERCARICYKSEDKMLDTKQEIDFDVKDEIKNETERARVESMKEEMIKANKDKFLRSLVERGHLSVFEHFHYCFKLHDKNLYTLLKLANKNKYLKVTPNFVSGNIRAFYDFINANSNILIADILHYNLTKHFDILFQYNGTTHIHLELIDDYNQMAYCAEIDEIIEHVYQTVIINTDRAIANEIVRHRTGSYSQESTRYCSYNADKFGSEISFMAIDKMLKDTNKNSALVIANREEIYDVWAKAMGHAQEAYMRMLELGAAPQVARSVLPLSTKTELAMSMSIAEWREFFVLRLTQACHPQMLEVSRQLLKAFNLKYPDYFTDFANQYKEDLKNVD